MSKVWALHDQNMQNY